MLFIGAVSSQGKLGSTPVARSDSWLRRYYDGAKTAKIWTSNAE
jgi:hypothetical protein